MIDRRVSLSAIACGMLALSQAAGAQSLDATPPSYCGEPASTSARTAAVSDSRALVRFTSGVASDTNDAFLARALSRLTAERVRRAAQVAVESRGVGAGAVQTDASSAIAEGRVLGVRFVLVGTVERLNERSVVTWRLVDARTGREMSSGVVTQALGSPDSLVTVATAALTRAFGRPSYVAAPYERIQSRAPDAINAYLRALSGLEAFDRQTAERTEDALLTAVRLDPSFLAAHYRIATHALRQLTWISQRDAERERLYKQGLAAVGQVLMRAPYDLQALTLLAALHVQGDAPELAQPIVSVLHKRAPDNPDVVAVEAQVLRMIGRSTQALQRLRARGGAADVSVEALLVLAELERHAGNTRQACRLLNRAVVLDPQHAPAYVWRAIVRSQLNERREAWADAEVAARLGRTDWGELAAALVDVSVGDSVRARNRAKPWTTPEYLAEGGWLDLVLAAYVSLALNRADEAQRALRQVSCHEPRRGLLGGDPLLRYVRLPTACSGRQAAAPAQPAAPTAPTRSSVGVADPAKHFRQ